MRGTVIVGLWLAAGAIVAAMILGLIAAGSARRQLVDDLRGAAPGDEEARRDREHLARETLARELARQAPDWELAVVAAVSLGEGAEADRARRQAGEGLTSEAAGFAPADLAQATRLLRALGRGDEDLLRAAAARWGGAAYAAEELAAATARLRAASGADVDREIEALASRVAALPVATSAAVWAAARLPPLSSALDRARTDAIERFVGLLAPYRVEPEESPNGEAPAVRVARVNAGDPAAPARLRRWWSALDALGALRGVDSAAIALYAAATRRTALPAEAIAVALGCLAALGGGLAFAVRRVVRGPIPVDPGAETLENVEPIDLDTDAETLDAKSRTSHDTRPAHDTTAS